MKSNPYYTGKLSALDYLNISPTETTDYEEHVSSHIQHQLSATSLEAVRPLV
jgi:hypothetical protein